MKTWNIVVSLFALALILGAQQAKQSSEKAASLDPQLQAVVDQLKGLGGKPIDTLSPEEARKQPSPADAVKAVLKSKGKSTDPEAVENVTNQTIPGPAGQIPIRVYRPTGNGPFPVVVYFHGGGFVIANLDTYDSSARALTNAARAVVMSVQYRQAPENPYPAAPEDAYAATQWAMDHAAEIGGQAGRVAVAGESAGGNLATVVTMMARDKKGKMPVHQLLVYPVVNGDMNTPSYQDSGNGPILTKAMMQWFFKYYKPDAKQAYAVPMLGNTSGLPPATVITDGFDVLRSEGMAYANKLRQSGVSVTLKNYPAMTHEFFGMGAVVDQAKQAVQDAAAGLKSSFDAAGNADRQK